MLKKSGYVSVMLSCLASVWVWQVQGVPTQARHLWESYKIGSREPDSWRGFPSGSAAFQAGGLTGDFCKLGDDVEKSCHETRYCGRMTDGHFVKCDEQKDSYCFCIPDSLTNLSCQSSRECTRGERCVIHLLANEATMCLSCKTWFLFSIFVPVDDGQVSCTTQHLSHYQPHTQWGDDTSFNVQHFQ